VQGRNGNIYQVFYEPGLGWGETVRLAAEERIGGIRGHLVTITSLEKDEFVGELTRLIGFRGFPSLVWLGGFQDLNQPSPQAGWQWINGEGSIPGMDRASPYANWHPGEPVDDGPTQEVGLLQFRFMVQRSGEFGWAAGEGGGGGSFRGYIVEFETGGETPPDCNQNRIHDAIDIVTGTSRDQDENGIPDECAISFRLLESESENCVRLVATTLIPMRGGEIGVAYDPGVVTPSCAQPGPDFPGGRGDIFCDLSPPLNCAPGEGVEAGFTVGWVNSGTGALLPPELSTCSGSASCVRPQAGAAAARRSGS
jgi:hypothetical protein